MLNYFVSGDVMRKTLFSLLSASLLLSAAAHAAEHAIRPGLWEMTTTSDLLKLVPHLPPDRMQQLRELARQNGIAMPDIQNGAATSKVCITQVMADRKIPPNLADRDSGCAANNVTRNGNSYSAELVCNGPRVKGNGRAEGAFSSAESFSGRTTFKGEVQGTPVDERAETSGRWIAANCGSVKPME
jgi:hypothetical protein